MTEINNPNSQEQPTKDSATSETNTSNPSPKSARQTAPNKPKKGLSLWSKIKLTFYTLVILAFMLLGGIIFILVNPDSDFALFADKYLGFNYVISTKNQSDPNRPSTDTSYSSSTNQNTNPNQNSNSGLVNNILGLNPDRGNSSKFSDSAAPSSNTAELVEKVLPSVLSISIETENDIIASPSTARGTGFFVSDDGLVMTNKHVIAKICATRANQSLITATDSQNKNWELDLISVDPTTDLAILKVRNPDNAKFSKVSFLPTQNLRLGTEVIAVGNALGTFDNTVTSGIISGLGRNVIPAQADECGGYSAFSEGLIQTDAAINEGNSGGPLFDRSGNLVGVNTFRADAQLIGLSIPADDVAKTLNSYLKYGKISKATLGVKTLNVDQNFKKLFPQIPVDYGAIIGTTDETGQRFILGEGDVTKDSGADKIGLKSADIILAVNDTEIRASNTNASPLRRAISRLEPGDKLKLKVLKSKIVLERGIDGSLVQTITYEANPIEVEATLGAIDSPV